MGLTLPILLLAFVALYFADLRAAKLSLAPRWYPSLRTPLTIIVTLCLLLAWTSVLVA
jgi:hypothetical protein